jgi:hypothetical protein
VAICVGADSSQVQQYLTVYRESNPQYVRMMDSQPNWIMGTPEEAGAQLAALGQAGIDRALLSVNCDLHLEMLPLLAESNTPIGGGVFT